MDKVTIEARSRNMARIRGKNTKPELSVRKLLTSKGLRYRIHFLLPGRPDIVFPSKKFAVFIHGCYWHGHGCKVDHVSKSNTEFWNAKIEMNKQRDRKNIVSLKRKGWKPVVIWECKIRKSVDLASKPLLRKLTTI